MGGRRPKASGSWHARGAQCKDHKQPLVKLNSKWECYEGHRARHAVHAAAQDQLPETVTYSPSEPDNPTRLGGKKETIEPWPRPTTRASQGRELIPPAFWRGQRTPFEPLPIRSSWAYMSRKILGIEEYLAPQRAPALAQGYLVYCCGHATREYMSPSWSARESALTSTWRDVSRPEVPWSTIRFVKDRPLSYSISADIQQWLSWSTFLYLV